MPPDNAELNDSIRLLSHQLKSPLDAIRSLLDGITHGLPAASPSRSNVESRKAPKGLARPLVRATAPSLTAPSRRATVSRSPEVWTLGAGTSR